MSSTNLHVKMATPQTRTPGIPIRRSEQDNRDFDAFVSIREQFAHTFSTSFFRPSFFLFYILSFLTILYIYNLKSAVAHRSPVGSRQESASASATASSATASPASSSSATSVSDVTAETSSVVTQQFWRNSLVGFSHNLTQVTSQLGVGLGEQRHSGTGGTGSSSSSDSMNIVLDVTRHVIVDNVGDTFDVCS